jgi:hypothetical protein
VRNAAPPGEWWSELCADFTSFFSARPATAFRFEAFAAILCQPSLVLQELLFENNQKTWFTPLLDYRTQSPAISMRGIGLH